MLQLDARYLEQVRQILARHLAGSEAKVYGFGSRARGDAHAKSDLDLAVDAPLSAQRYALLVADFIDSPLPFRTDVVDLRTTTPAFYRNICDDFIQIY